MPRRVLTHWFVVIVFVVGRFSPSVMFSALRTSV